MIARGDLPLRPRYLRGESLAGYIYRFHSVNGHELTKAAKEVIADMYCRGPAFINENAGPKMRTILGDDCPIDVTGWADAWRQICQINVPSLSLRKAWKDTVALCPSCIRETDIHLSLWELPLVDACPVHHCKLRTDCDRCGRILEWSRLSLDWTCRCGFSLKELQTKSATSAEYMRASIICTALDLQLPIGHKFAFVSLDEGTPISLASIYHLLVRFHNFRWVAAHKLTLGIREKQGRSRVPVKVRTLPHVWECKMLTSWPYGFQDALLRMARRICRGQNGTFVMLHRRSLLKKSIDVLAGKQSEYRIADPVQLALSQLIAQTCIPFPTLVPVIFNPNLSVEQLTYRMLEFGQWWQMLCSTALSHDRSLDSCSARWLGHPTCVEDREPLVVRIANHLVDFANTGVDPTRCSRMFAGWHDVGRIPAVGDPRAITAELWFMLMKVPIPLLKRMLRVAQWVHRTRAP